MKIPKKIKIGGVRYTVKKIGTESDLDGAAGKITTEQCLIRVLEGKEDFMMVTFLHEVIHAINMELGEETTEFLAQALYQVIIDNPKIFEGGGEKHEE